MTHHNTQQKVTYVSQAYFKMFSKIDSKIQRILMGNRHHLFLKSSKVAVQFLKICYHWKGYFSHFFHLKNPILFKNVHTVPFLTTCHIFLGKHYLALLGLSRRALIELNRELPWNCQSSRRVINRSRSP